MHGCLTQPPLWSAGGIGWRSSPERPFDNIDIDTRREVTSKDEKQSYFTIVA